MGIEERILINTRCLQRNLKGARRYLEEIISYFPDSFARIYPKRLKSGLGGQLWEQCILPCRLKGRVLWSPTGTGPIVAKNQVVTIHDISPVEHPQWFTRSYAKWMKFIIPLIINRVKHVITISEYTKSRLVELLKVKEDKITVIHNGVSRKFSPCSQKEKCKVKNDLNLPSSKYILSLGTISPRKNIFRLLKSWEIAQEAVDDDIWLVVVGEKGPVHKSIELEIPDRVHFTGFVSDDKLPALYSGAMVFVYPSLYEGFGLPPLEAMATGTPSIVGNRTSLPEVVGEAGILVNPSKVYDIAKSIIHIIKNNEIRNTLKNEGIKRAKKFTWEKAASETWKVLKKAV